MSSSTREWNLRLESAKTLASSFDTLEVSLERLEKMAIVIACSSVTDNTGSFVLQVAIGNSGWINITSIPAMTLANAAATFLVDPFESACEKFRVKFTAAGGTPDGTVTIDVNCKGW